MDPVFLDVETTTQDPEPFLIPDVSTMEPPASYKKEDSIAKWREEKAATLLDDLRAQTSLDPFLGGTVVVAAIAVGGKKPTVLVAPTADESGELELLTKLEKGLARYNTNPLVTWNGSSFDLPYLAKRAIRHGLYSLAARMHQDKPWTTNHVDLFRVWQQHDRTAKGKLSAVAQFFGIPSDEFEITGKEVAQAIANEEPGKVIAHCAADVERLRAIYWRMRAASWVQGTDTIPDELPVRPPRVTERKRLLFACAEIQIELDKGTIKAAAETAGIPWTGEPPAEDGPEITNDTPVEALRVFLTAMQAARVAA